MLIAGVAHLNGDRVAVERLLPVGFPMPFIDAVTARRGAFACPTLETWFGQAATQLWTNLKDGTLTQNPVNR